MKITTSLLGLTFCACFSASEAGDFSGFATLGLVHSDSDIYGYRRDISEDTGVFDGDIDVKNNSLLGLQFDHLFSSKTDFVIQAVIRHRSKNNLNRTISLAFLRHQLTPHWQVRVGRIAPDLFMLTESRDIDFSYIWATVPKEVYSIIPYRHIDGGDISYERHLDTGKLTTRLFAGSSEGEVIGGGELETVKSEKMLGVSITYDEFEWSIQGKYTRTTFANEAATNLFIRNQIANVPDFIWPNKSTFIPRIGIESKTAKYSAINGQRMFGNWILSAEFSRISSSSELLNKISNYYISAAYQFDHHSFYAVLGSSSSDSWEFNEPDVATQFIPELIHGIEENFNFYSANQKSYSLGWRWNASASTSLTFQYTHTKVAEHGSTLWLVNGPHSPAGKINSLLFNVSTLF